MSDYMELKAAQANYLGSQIAKPYTVTGNGQVITGKCWVVAVRTNVIGTSATLTLHDGVDNTGKPVLKGIPTATINVAGYGANVCPNGAAVYCQNGLYAAVGGTGSPEFTVYAWPAP